MRLEHDLDAITKMDPPEMQSNGLYPGECPCRSCGEPTARKYIDQEGNCDRDECLLGRGVLPRPQYYIQADNGNWWTMPKQDSNEFGGWKGPSSKKHREPALFDESTAKLIVSGMRAQKIKGTVIVPSYDRYYANL